MENWFKHDSTAHADAKILQLLMHDKAYYANYWLTLEWLFLLEDATASNKELDSLYYFLRETKEYTNEFIDFCLDIGLFVKEENCFYSTRLKEQKLKQAEKSAKAKDSIARRWNNRNTNVIRTYPENDTNVIQNRIEENRIEESTNVDSLVQKKSKTPKDIAIEFFTNSDKRNEVANAFSVQSGLNLHKVQDEIQNFLNYWTEQSQNGKKERWQLQKTFDVKLRLMTWFRNSGKYSFTSSPKSTHAYL